MPQLGKGFSTHELRFSHKFFSPCKFKTPEIQRVSRI
uniref:Uncharacterized protein n=1 Tax=Rhizophora mucronata TaxID=61149 RepID=A0A2P2N2I2_RHIMU